MNMRTGFFAVLGVCAAFGLGRQVTAAVPPGSSDKVAHGRQLFFATGCSQCHGLQGQGSSAGPKLAPTPIPFAAFIVQVRTPRERMPLYTASVMSENDMADLYAYLQSIPKQKTLEQIPLLQGLRRTP